MPTSRSRSSTPGAWLAAALLSAYGCAALFDMEDATCVDCTASDVAANSPDPGQEPMDALGTRPAPGAENASAAGDVASTPAETNAGSRPGASVAEHTPEPTGLGTSPADAGSADSGAGPTQDELCARYCERITSTCIAGVGDLPDNRAYVDRDACLKLCPFFSEGAAGERAVNTLQCRLELLESAEADEPSAVCQAAGRGGQLGTEPVCGSNCDAYCSLMERVCPAEFAALAPSCASVCGGLEDRLAFDVVRDERGGNSVQCRLWHVGLAAACDPQQDPGCLARHCGHARGESPCNPPAP